VLSAVYARGYIHSLLRTGELSTEQLKLFYISFSLLMMVVIFGFMSNNLALFWILLELTTVLSAVLIVTLNAKENIVAALKYVFTASTAMLFSVIGLIILFAISQQAAGTGTLNWSDLMAQAGQLPPDLFTLASILIIVGFAAKAGIVPFHTWLPQAHAKAPSVISVLLSAVILNVGMYGILRLDTIANRTGAMHTISIILIIFGMLSIALAAFSMLTRSNIKKLIAFSSIEHMGLILVGIGLGTPLVIFWVLFYTLAHAAVKTLLFFSAGILHQQYGSNKLDRMHNTMVMQPLATWGMIIGGIAIIGTPVFPVFLPKLYILMELGNWSIAALIIVLLLFLIVAAAFASLLVPTFSRKATGEIPDRYFPDWTMKAPIIALMAGIVILGVWMPESFRQALTAIVASLGY